MYYMNIWFIDYIHIFCKWSQLQDACFGSLQITQSIVFSVMVVLIHVSCKYYTEIHVCICILHGWYLMSQVLLLMHHPSHGRGLTSFCVLSLKTTRLISSIYILHDEHYVSQLGVNHVYYCICITTVIKYTVGYNKQTRISFLF